jgi:hypothetical protein
MAAVTVNVNPKESMAFSWHQRQKGASEMANVNALDVTGKPKRSSKKAKQVD